MLSELAARLVAVNEDMLARAEDRGVLLGEVVAMLDSYVRFYRDHPIAFRLLGTRALDPALSAAWTRWCARWPTGSGARSTPARPGRWTRCAPRAPPGRRSTACWRCTPGARCRNASCARPWRGGAGGAGGGAAGVGARRGGAAAGGVAGRSGRHTRGATKTGCAPGGRTAVFAVRAKNRRSVRDRPTTPTRRRAADPPRALLHLARHHLPLAGDRLDDPPRRPRPRGPRRGRRRRARGSCRSDAAVGVDRDAGQHLPRPRRSRGARGRSARGRSRTRCASGSRGRATLTAIWKAWRTLAIFEVSAISVAQRRTRTRATSACDVRGNARPWRAAARSTAPPIASSSCSAPPATSARREDVAASGSASQLGDDRRRVDPGALGASDRDDLGADGPARRRGPRPAGRRRQLVASASAARRDELAPEHVGLRAAALDVDAGAAQRRCERGRAGLGHVTVTNGARWTTRAAPSRWACTRTVPATTRRRSARAAPPCARRR